jgi:hypothetical protein
LDIADKHNQLILTQHIALVGHLVVRAGGTVITLKDCTLNLGEPVSLLRGRGHPEVEGNFEPSLEVCFAKGLPFGDEAVVPTLVNQSQRISEVIEAFAALIA